MKFLFLLSMPGPVMGTVLVLSIVVLVYSVAKAIMRYLDKKKEDNN